MPESRGGSTTGASGSSAVDFGPFARFWVYMLMTEKQGPPGSSELRHVLLAVLLALGIIVAASIIIGCLEICGVIE